MKRSDDATCTPKYCRFFAQKKKINEQKTQRKNQTKFPILMRSYKFVFAIFNLHNVTWEGLV